MQTEGELRKQAINLHQQGMKIAEISRRLGRTRQWIYKWLERYNPNSQDWWSNS